MSSEEHRHKNVFEPRSPGEHSQIVEQDWEEEEGSVPSAATPPRHEKRLPFFPPTGVKRPHGLPGHMDARELYTNEEYDEEEEDYAGPYDLNWFFTTHHPELDEIQRIAVARTYANYLSALRPKAPRTKKTKNE